MNFFSVRQSKRSPKYSVIQPDGDGCWERGYEVELNTLKLAGTGKIAGQMETKENSCPERFLAGEKVYEF
jgi:hypothetical protein